MEEKYCQSCGMPMQSAVYGTNADGSENPDYCSYCYANGAFTADCSMEQMIAFCASRMAAANAGMSKEQASQQMRLWFPTLKRWKK